MGTYNDVNPTPLDMSGWETIFFDGFNGGDLDRSLWPVTYGGSALYWNSAFRWENDQLSVGDGQLTIGMEREWDGLWSVGGLSTLRWPGAPSDIGSSFLYGRVEIHSKTSQEVVGAGPCFLLWPSDNSWPPEIDILETPQSGQGMFTNHWPGPNGEDVYKSHFFDLDHSQWHTYALDWFPDRLTFYVDGVEVYTTTENVPHIPMSVGLQGHVGRADDGWYGSPNWSGVDQVDIDVDWVRVSKYTGGDAPAPARPMPVIEGSAPQWGGDIRGSDDADWLAGGAGGDVLFGAGGEDDLQGGGGDDVLRGGGGPGLDGLTGGEGHDAFVFRRGDGQDWVVDFSQGQDRIVLEHISDWEVGQAFETRSGQDGLALHLGHGDDIFLAGVGSYLGAGDIVFA